jgi:hypothetical protein
MYTYIRPARQLDKANAVVSSEVALNELDKLGNGDTSCKHALASAACAVADGASNEATVKMAAMSVAAHCERDLHTWLRHSPFGGQGISLYSIRLTLKMRGAQGSRQYYVPTIPPRLIMARMWVSGHDQFRRSVLGTAGAILGCTTHWENLFRDEEVRESHPLCCDPDLAKHANITVPFNLHMDGAAMLRNFELDIWSGSSALTRGCSWDTKWLTVLIPHECTVPATHGEVIAYWNDEFKILNTGIHPRLGRYLENFDRLSYMHKYRGKQIAGGWRAAFSGTKMDNKAKVEVNSFGRPFPRNYHSNFCCEFDAAMQGGPEPESVLLSIARTGRDAPWRNTMISTQCYLACTRDKGKPSTRVLCKVCVNVSKFEL